MKKEEDLIQSSSELLTEAEQAANLKAIKEVVAAKKAGELKGAKAAKQVLARQKSQTPAQNQKDISLLQKKLENTSKQVSKIIANFGNVHKDLQDLKTEYIQSQNQDESDDSENVQLEIDQKEIQVAKMKKEFSKIRQGLAQIKVVPEFRPLVENITLQLDNAYSEDIEDIEDIQLSDSLSLISEAHLHNQIVQKKLESIMRY